MTVNFNRNGERATLIIGLLFMSTFLKKKFENKNTGNDGISHEYYKSLSLCWKIRRFRFDFTVSKLLYINETEWRK
jgi:hypothetical protein